MGACHSIVFNCLLPGVRHYSKNLVYKVLISSLHESCKIDFPNVFIGSEVKASAWNAGDLDSIPGLGRSLGEGNDNPLQYSCLENPMEGGAW